MAVQQRTLAAGTPATQAAALAGTVANALTAAGNSQATALALPADINRFTTVAASTGTILPAMNPGDYVEIFNGGANALAVYPPVGGAINAIAANSPYNVATATPYCRVRCVTPTQYIAQQSA